MRARREARILALQVLYEADTAQHPAGEVLQRSLREQPGEAADADSRDYAIQLVSGITTTRQELDTILADCAPDFPIQDIAPIDRNILRIALFEMRAGLAPLKVAMNEAIEIAKQYGGDTTPRFINGALGTAIARFQAAGVRP